MKNEIQLKIKRHQAFLERKNVARPLIGCIRGWENLSRYTSDGESFFPLGDVNIHDLSCDRFLPMYQEYAATLDEPDDMFRTLEPLPFFPWAEAAIGCPIKYTGKNFCSSPLVDLTSEAEGKQLLEVLCQIPERSQPWLEKYGEFLDFLAEHFGDHYPIGQSILRGPLDMAAAAFGDENLLYQFFDQPELVRDFLFAATDIFLDFIDVQKGRISYWGDGHVIGTYYIWTPGKNIRLQEDAMAMLSPDLYREFVHPLDCRIASSADYTLFHLHATGLHLLDFILQNEGIKIVQVSKDEGVKLEKILASLQRIQAREKCLLLKGRFNQQELQLVKEGLDFRGLCVQAVVLNQQEVEDILSIFS
jgi:hypothetical protein